MSGIVIKDINIDQFNPFGASAEELIANALDESGLISPDTTLNEVSAKEFCKLYFMKRENYKNSTKLGNLLVKNNIITFDQLQETLAYQKKHPSKKLGDVLVLLNMCTYEDIEKILDTQAQIRYDIRELDEFVNKINNIKERLIKYISS